jgi:hypothetical protein
VAKPVTFVTPPNRIERWKKLWATPKKLNEAETDAAFDEFLDNLVPTHMHTLFLRKFGLPKASFGNRFFNDESMYQNWDLKLTQLLAAEGPHIEATVIYGSPDKLEAHTLRGERRRSLRDIVIDDWHAACAIVRSDRVHLYVFIEPKMRGCIVRSLKLSNVAAEEETSEEPELVEFEP